MLAWSCGIGIFEGLKRLFGLDKSSNLNPVLTIFLGIAGITCLTAYLSLFVKIGLIANMIVLGGGVLLLLNARKSLPTQFSKLKKAAQNLNLLQWSVFVVGLIYILFLSSQQSLSMDEGTYYAQSILWAESFPIVKGLSNVISKLGFNTHWHLTAALFNWSFVTGQESNQLNGFVYLLTLGFCLSALKGEFNKISNWMRLTLLVFLHYSPLHVFHIIAPNADIPVIFGTWILLSLLLEKIEENKLNVLDGRGILILFLLGFFVTIKLSSLPILLCALPFVWTFLKQGDWQKIVGTAIIFGVFLFPWMVRNVYLSGYLIYPFAGIDLFNVDWKVPLEQVQKEAKWIKDAAFLLAKTDHNNAVMTLPYWERLQIWFTDNLHLNDRLLVMGLMLSPILQMVSFAWKKSPFYQKKDYLILCGVLWGGIVFWLWNAPNPRFGYGFTIFAFLLSVVPFIALIKIPKRILLGLALLGILGFQTVTYWYYQKKMDWFLAKEWIVRSETNHSIFWMPKPYPPTNTTSVEDMLYVPQKCWDTALPCFAKRPRKFKKRGEQWEDGFKPLPSTNKKAND